MDPADALRIETHGAVHLLTLDRPALLNRLDAPAHAALIQAFADIAARPDLRCVVLAATGKAFSAGGDLNEVFALHDHAARRQAMFDQGRALFAALIATKLPVIVAMQGDAHGLGANIALACDAVVASRNVRISDAHVRVGLVAGDGGCVVWPHSMGLLRAKRYLLTGDALTAEAAFAMGLITDLVDTAEQVLPAAMALAQRIAALAPLAVQGTKQALNALLSRRAEEVFELALQLEAATMASDDVVEAANAFLQRRPPVYQGS
jgi:enoyl-CoA hydratase